MIKKIKSNNFWLFLILFLSKPIIIRKYISRSCHFVFILLIILLVACDLGGNLFLTNGYTHDVVVVSQYIHRGNILESREIFREGEVFNVDARRPEYSNIFSVKIESINGDVLAEYSSEYLINLRNMYREQGRQESWIFTEKGLFYITSEISKRFNFDNERILEYYRSDDAGNERDGDFPL